MYLPRILVRQPRVHATIRPEDRQLQFRQPLHPQAIFQRSTKRHNYTQPGNRAVVGALACLPFVVPAACPDAPRLAPRTPRRRPPPAIAVDPWRFRKLFATMNKRVHPALVAYTSGDQAVVGGACVITLYRHPPLATQSSDRWHFGSAVPENTSILSFNIPEK